MNNLPPPSTLFILGEETPNPLLSVLIVKNKPYNYISRNTISKCLLQFGNKVNSSTNMCRGDWGVGTDESFFILGNIPFLMKPEGVLKEKFVLILKKIQKHFGNMSKQKI